ncbi:hypothetical protein TD95_002048 [Thielaviopsis punctulata]|uniref:Ribosomal RNA-processing protein 7 C-terminal domain-containing protein n=1 Tax=Thielaviopsis punctulata TaxID=72032 RepID=A0A0F4ZFE8_9PEZI|nr:hypothetical protein TD95_002048 [Thielaviopsis punctulata]
MAPAAYEAKAADDAFVRFLVSMPPTDSFPVSATHEMRVRRNTPKIPSPTDSRSLYVKNIPADSSEAHFRALFAQLMGPGCFESIVFRAAASPALELDPAQAVRLAGPLRKRKRDDDAERAAEEHAAQLPALWTRPVHESGAAAIVVLADAPAVRLALKKIAKTSSSAKARPEWGVGVPATTEPLGAMWIMEHLQLCRPDRAETQAAVHAFFNVFNRKEKEAAALAKRLRSEPDEDGFVTVTRGSRAAPASRTEAEAARERMVAKEAKKKEDMVGFYRFQVRERRKAEQQALIKRFESDRKRVEALKEKRGKFKPES